VRTLGIEGANGVDYRLLPNMSSFCCGLCIVNTINQVFEILLQILLNCAIIIMLTKQ